MRRRFVIGAVLPAMLALAFQPAPAGPYDTDAGQVQGATALVFLKDGLAGVWIARTAGVHFYGNLNAPQSSSPAYQPRYTVYTGTQVPDQAPDETKRAMEDPQFVGCVFLFRFTGSFDLGCSVRPGAMVSMDPVMAQGVVTFTVKSVVVPGYSITTTLLFKGIADIKPFPDNGVQQTVSPAPPARPLDVNVWMSGMFQRSATVTGRIVSDTAGGGTVRGPLVSVFPPVMISGIGGARCASVDGVPDCLAALARRGQACQSNPNSPACIQSLIRGPIDFGGHSTYDLRKSACLRSTRPNQPDTCFDEMIPWP